MSQALCPQTDGSNTAAINTDGENVDLVRHDEFDDSNEASGIERDTNSSVRVAVRVRPLLHFEQGSDHCMQVMKSNMNDTYSNVIQVGGQESGPRFTFDQVFDYSITQEILFQTAVSPLVSCCLEGYNATILAYGQTGSGKTHTMMGPSPTTLSGTRKRRREEKQPGNLDPDVESADTSDEGDGRDEDDDRESSGIIPRVLQSLFNSLEDAKAESAQSTNLFDYQVSLQFLELYGEEIRDLLTGHNRDTKLTIRDLGTDEPEVVGATQQTVSTAEEALLCLSRGMLRRVTGATAMNESSSRSHVIFSVLIEQQRTIHISNSDENTPNFNESEETNHVQVTHSRFNLVDLAGSERQKRTQAEGKRLKEGIDINKGLLVLGNVISALGDPKKRGKTFVPYRDSKLTRLLKGSLGGNHKTLMIACVSPSSANMEESLNCLRYANRAKNIQNNAVVNVDGNSRLMQELQAHVQILASDLIRIIEANQDTTTSYPRKTLEIMASGGKGGLPVTSSGLPGTPSVSTYPSQCGNLDGERRLQEMEIELCKTKDLLRESRSYHDSAEEQLYVVRAQKELADLQLSVLKDTSNTRGFNSRNDSLQDAFLAKITSYETDIGKLKNELQESKSKLQKMKWALNKNVTWADDEDQVQLINDATQQVNDERRQLFELQANLHGQEANQHEVTDKVNHREPLDRIDEQQLQDEADLQNLTKKYLHDSAQDDYDDVPDEIETEDRNPMFTPDHKLQKSLLEIGINKSASTRPSPTQRERKVQADLAELSRSIEAKESLIEQLKLSQEKYASMREFYEERLRQMEVVLSEKEREREVLVRELKRSKEVGHTGTKEIEEKIGQKEKHIADLRKKQQELMKLTAVSSRNDLEIRKLHDEVQTMKRMKVDLQRKLADEKKTHAKQLKDMQKHAMLKEKELTKAKRISSQREIEAMRANQVAKQRLDELAQLRTKYRDSEKKLRMASLKRGVLAKAGLDPVMIGRRENGFSPGSSPDREQHFSRRRGNVSESNSPGSTNIDLLRAYFEQKVAGVARKEAIVDKLAHEWEAHFELSNRKQELLAQKNNQDEAEELDDAQQALLIQIQFKEERIRKLAARLGKVEETPEEHLDVSQFKSESFLFGKEFHSICKGSKTEKSYVTGARVLFGMIVRERRRVAALARTASSLDEKALRAEREAELSEAALRSYVEEQRHEIAALTQNQQDHILSLMDMVKDDSAQLPSASNAKDVGRSEEVFQRKLLVLANERVNLLEKQITELQLQLTENNSYREKLEDTMELLNEKQQEYEIVHAELIELRLALRHIREVLRTASPGEIVNDDRNSIKTLLVDIVGDALHPVRGDDNNDTTSPGSNRPPRPIHSTDRGVSAARFGSKFVASILSDSDGDNDATDETPEWANDIMADLALIAEGKLPPSMEKSAAVLENVSQFDKHFHNQNKFASNETKASSVFDRLSDPKQFTGTQKQVQKASKHSSTAAAHNSIQKVHPRGTMKAVRRRDDKKLVSTTSDSITASRHSEGSTNAGQDESRNHQSVFDRLVSPSHYTGTQKEKFQESKLKRERTAEQVADRVLDGLLHSKESGVRNPTDSNLSQHDHSTGAPSRNHTIYTEYAKQDVFERLQKTTTQAFAVKTLSTVGDGHHNSNDENHRWHSHDMATQATTADQNQRFGSTTNRQESPPSQETAADKNSHSNYIRQDVFERLQRTTTEAYAKKANPKYHHIDSENMH